MYGGGGILPVRLRSRICIQRRDLCTRTSLLGNQLIKSDHSYLDRAIGLMIRRDAGTGEGRRRCSGDEGD